MEQQTGKRGPFKWWYGLLFYASIQVAEWGLRQTVRGMRRNRTNQKDRSFYQRQKQPVFAPPSLAFPIAWTINSASSLAGALHVLNTGHDTQEKARFLGFQAAAWLLFVTFNTAYFELHSPINAAAVTFAYSGVTAASIKSAVRMKDWSAILSLLPTASWLVLANPVAVTVAAWNRDEFWNAGPFLDPPKALLK